MSRRSWRRPLHQVARPGGPAHHVAGGAVVRGRHPHHLRGSRGNIILIAILLITASDLSNKVRIPRRESLDAAGFPGLEAFLAWRLAMNLKQISNSRSSVVTAMTWRHSRSVTGVRGISSSSLRPLLRPLRVGLVFTADLRPFPRLAPRPSYSKSESDSGSEPGSAIAYSSSFLDNTKLNPNQGGAGLLTCSSLPTCPGCCCCCPR